MYKKVYLSEKSFIENPDLLFIQKNQFSKLLNCNFKNRNNYYLYIILKNIFPIINKKKDIYIKFIDYFLNTPKFKIKQCLKEGITYNVNIKIIIQLFSKRYKINKYKILYLGLCPYMTKYGSFIFNGSERVIVSQIYRSNNIYFYTLLKKNNNKLYYVKIIPKKGVWLKIYIDENNISYIIIDKKPKILLTIFLKCLGYKNDKEILKLFNIIIKEKKKKLINKKIYDKKTIYCIKKQKKILKKDIKFIYKKSIYIINEKNYKKYNIILNTLKKSKYFNYNKCIDYVNNILKQYKIKNKYNIFKEILFNKKKYLLSNYTRLKLNKLFNIKKKKYIFNKNDIILIIKYLIKLNLFKIKCFDVDDLSNRKIKTVYNHLKNLFVIGIKRLQKNIKNKLNKNNINKIKFSELINSKIITSIINSFFGTHQLSQFMDQTNILSEITHKRRLSLLGPGGISKDKATFKIRDINNSFYGRLCPIETPEGPNIGLISSLCVFTKINKYNFLKTPYINLKKNNKVEYLSYDKEKNKIFSTYNVLKKKKKYYLCRKNSNFLYKKYKYIDYIDVDYNQIISISASQIPFLEHDDANRILMGANMMRQSVPLLYPKSPIVNTYLNKNIIKNSRNLLYSEYNGIIKYVDNNKIILKYKNKYKKINLIKFKRTNQNTCYNLKPIVKKNDKILKNQILCEGYSTKNKELALGRNILVAFMPFKGYNFEDAIVVSKKLVKKDYFTSLHIEELSLEVKNTKLGKELLTKNISNISDDNKNKLNDKGIINVGCSISPGDVLIGKLTPKEYEYFLSPEKKLLNYIYNKKFSNYKDTSLRAYSTLYGVVIDVNIFVKKKKIKNIKFKINKLLKEYLLKKKEIKKYFVKKILYIIYKNKLYKKHIKRKKIFKNKKKINYSCLYKNIDNINFFENIINNKKIYNNFYNIYIKYLYKKNELKNFFNKKKDILINENELINNNNNNILKIIKICILKKRILQVGDKISGRHGNKGVISKIVNEEDMPFLKNGKIIEMILNPLGVPSRMNIGQILETILGIIGKKRKEKYYIKPFNSINIKKINELLKKNNLPKDCKFTLYDGETGEKFNEKITVGYMYMLKLNHMIEDKIHARSIGPYSLITQQPLGGKSQYGGQRFGEMEV
ncbi:MAG: DNA-directed RNA polymerase subunit beta [Candidatus Shikimatogenerans sp. Ttur]|uniref:DNA-directed RNA polymerase n=1 Tax=Candidatus Shikimatogenerans sp. Ttur TaxID=3158569 RepID=A0AAU7ZXH2_9FLAO